MTKKVDVAWHVQVRVSEDMVWSVKQWIDRFGYMLGDGWAFNQNIQEWTTIDGMSEWEWDHRNDDNSK